MPLGPAEIAHGPMFIGLLFNILLYGIMIAQCYIYYTTSERDPMWMKLFVFLLFIADTTNSVFDVIYLYDTLVIHFNEPSHLAHANWVFSTDPALTAIIAALVQGFFSWRVRVLTGNIWCSLAIIIFAITGLLSGIGTAIACGIIPAFSEFRKFRIIVILWLAANVCGDIIITTSLVWYLTKRKTGFAVTDDVVNRIIRLTVETGMLTMICATIDMMTYLLMPTGIHLIFNFALSKLYTNSLMSSLNSRAQWKVKFNASGHLSVGGRGGQTSQTLAKSGSKMSGDGQFSRPEVLVHVERHQMRDWNDMEPKFPVTPNQDETIVKFKPVADNLDYDYAADVEYSSQELTDTPKSKDIGKAV